MLLREKSKKKKSKVKKDKIHPSEENGDIKALNFIAPLTDIM
jgi:hypothetical protein